jgi:pimeloyl-ACP methyl ester carboxylesterase
MREFFGARSGKLCWHSMHWTVVNLKNEAASLRVFQHSRPAHGFGHPNLGRWLSRIPNETLIVWGEKDRLTPPGRAKIWASLIPKAKALMVPGVSHFAMQEAPTTVTAIGDFLARG